MQNGIAITNPIGCL